MQLWACLFEKLNMVSDLFLSYHAWHDPYDREPFVDPSNFASQLNNPRQLNTDERVPATGQSSDTPNVSGSLVSQECGV